LSAKPRILVIGHTREAIDRLLGPSAEACEVVVSPSPAAAWDLLAKERCAGAYVGSDHLQEAFEIGRLLQNEQILQGMPAGVVLVDRENTILWCNGRLGEWTGCPDVVGRNFYAALGDPEILGPDF